MTAVAPSSWDAAVRQARSEGYGYFDWLGCVDEIGRSDTLRIVLVLRNLASPGRDCLTLTTEVPRDDARLDSISDVFTGAGWHEREAAELFGMDFVGGDHRRLLLDANFSGTPLRKDQVLAARAGASWPGAKEPGETEASPSRRRMVPAGVPDPAVWGDRDPDKPAAEPAEVADSAVGGRVRRRER
ncbi:MAG: NADH-quinone oxidoreductase subunit C [Propionibacteriaceae bacterium]|nr:NADH-quinone oxidoreductase subunit C [Propionibacteriaceae bacterium]